MIRGHHFINLFQQVRLLISEINKLQENIEKISLPTFKEKLDYIKTYLSEIKFFCEFLISKEREFIKERTLEDLKKDIAMFQYFSMFIEFFKEIVSYDYAIGKDNLDDKISTYVFKEIQNRLKIKGTPLFFKKLTGYGIFKDDQNKIFRLESDKSSKLMKLTEEEAKILASKKFIDVEKGILQYTVWIKSPNIFVFPLMDQNRLFNLQLNTHEIAHQKIHILQNEIGRLPKITEELLADLLSVYTLGPCFVHCLINHLFLPEENVEDSTHPLRKIRIMACMNLLKKLGFNTLLGLDLLGKDGRIIRDKNEWEKEVVDQDDIRKKIISDMVYCNTAIDVFNSNFTNVKKHPNFYAEPLVPKCFDDIPHKILDDLMLDPKKFEKERLEKYDKLENLNNIAVFLNVIWLAKLKLIVERGSKEFLDVKDKVDNIVNNGFLLLKEFIKK